MEAILAKKYIVKCNSVKIVASTEFCETMQSPFGMSSGLHRTACMSKGYTISFNTFYWYICLFILTPWSIITSGERPFAVRAAQTITEADPCLRMVTRLSKLSSDLPFKHTRSFCSFTYCSIVKNVSLKNRNFLNYPLACRALNPFDR